MTPQENPLLFRYLEPKSFLLKLDFLVFKQNLSLKNEKKNIINSLQEMLHTLQSSLTLFFLGYIFSNISLLNTKDSCLTLLRAVETLSYPFVKHFSQD